MRHTWCRCMDWHNQQNSRLVCLPLAQFGSHVRHYSCTQELKANCYTGDVSWTPDRWVDSPPWPPVTSSRVPDPLHTYARLAPRKVLFFPLAELQLNWFSHSERKEASSLSLPLGPPPNSLSQLSVPVAWVPAVALHVASQLSSPLLPLSGSCNRPRRDLAIQISSLAAESICPNWNGHYKIWAQPVGLFVQVTQTSMQPESRPIQPAYLEFICKVAIKVMARNYGMNTWF